MLMKMANMKVNTKTKRVINIRDSQVIVQTDTNNTKILLHPVHVCWFYELTNNYVATTAWDNVIRIWHVTDDFKHEEIITKCTTLKGHTDRVINLLQCGNRLISASYDGKVVVWQLHVAKKITTKVIYVGSKGFMDICLVKNRNQTQNHVVIMNLENVILQYDLDRDIATRVTLAVPNPTFNTDEDLFNYLFVVNRPTDKWNANATAFDQMVYEIESLTDEQREEQIAEMNKHDEQLACETWYKTEEQLLDYVKRQNRYHSY